MGERIPTRIKKDFQLEVIFEKSIRQILGLYFFQKDWERDLKEASDFVLIAEKIACGFRVRRQKYLSRYLDEFTVRWSRPSGVDTEYQKIMKGFMTDFLYAFCNESKEKIIAYRIMDMDIFRKTDPKPITIKENINKDSKLAAYRYDQFPKTLILKTYPEKGW